MAEKYFIEKTWITKSGLLARVAIMPSGHRCGYVGVQKEHKMFGLPYHMTGSIIDGVTDITCHFGLTYSGIIPDDNHNDYWWFGFDCWHCDDLIDPEIYSNPEYRAENKPQIDEHGRTLKDLDFCIENCESMAFTLQQRTLDIEKIALANHENTDFPALMKEGDNILCFIFMQIHSIEQLGLHPDCAINSILMNYRKEPDECGDDLCGYWEYRRSTLLNSDIDDIVLFFKLKYSI